MANSPARSAIDVGSVIADTYTIEAMIGRGGMGAVFLASHKRLPGKQVAIKVLHTDADDPEILIRFRREAEIASRLGHPNIVAVSDYNVTPEGMPYLVLEYLHGETLAQRIKAGPMPLDQTLRIARQVGSALAAAHREGIVHRDLKPQNIFLVPTEIDGNTIEIAKVLDFGISKIRGSETVKTQDNSLLGTPQYMAPEQATGQHTLVDQRTDVFALGAIIYEMLTGHPAFGGASIPEVVFKVVYEQPKPLAEETVALPKNVLDAVETAMQKTANDRFANVSTFVEALTGQELAGFKVTTIPPPSGGFAGGSKISRNSKDLAAVVAPPGPNDDAAFANTMGSGDHGATPVPVPVSTPLPATTGVDATMASSGKTPSIIKPGAATLESQRLGVDATIASSGSGKTPTPLPVGAIGPSGVQSVLDDQPPPAATGIPAAKRPMVFAIIGALGVLLVGAVVVAIVFATRGNGDGNTPARVAAAGGTDAGAAKTVSLDTPPPPAIDAATTPAATPVDAGSQPAAVDAPVAAVKPDAAKTSTKDAGAATPPPPTPAGDPEIEAMLKRAEAAVQTNSQDAEQLANQVMVHEGVNADETAHAHAIRAKAFCVTYHEEEARDSLRPVAGHWRKVALDFCHKIGQLPNDN